MRLADVRSTDEPYEGLTDLVTTDRKAEFDPQERLPRAFDPIAGRLVYGPGRVRQALPWQVRATCHINRSFRHTENASYSNGP